MQFMKCCDEVQKATTTTNINIPIAGQMFICALGAILLYIYST